MDESDDSVDFIADTPSPLFTRHPIHRNRSQNSVINLCSSDDDSRSPVISRNLTASRRDGFQPNHSSAKPTDDGDSLPLPGQSGFAAERAKALYKKKLKERFYKANGTNNANMPHRHGPHDSTASRDQVKLPNSKCPDFIKASDVHKNLLHGSTDSGGNSDALARKPKQTAECVSKQRRKRNILRWPSSSDSSADEEDGGSERLRKTFTVNQSRKYSPNTASASNMTSASRMATEVSGQQSDVGCEGIASCSGETIIGSKVRSHGNASGSRCVSGRHAPSSTDGNHLKRKHACPCSNVNGRVKCLKCRKKDSCVNVYGANKGSCEWQGTSASSVSPCKRYKVSPTSSVVPRATRLESNTQPVQSSSGNSSSAKYTMLPTSSVGRLHTKPVSPNKSPIRTNRFYTHSNTSPTSSKCNTTTAGSPCSPLSRRLPYHKHSHDNDFPSSPYRRFSSSSDEKSTSPVISPPASLWLSKKSESKKSLFGKRPVPVRKQLSTDASSSSTAALRSAASGSLRSSASGSSSGSSSSTRGASGSARETSGAAVDGGSVLTPRRRLAHGRSDGTPLTPATKQALDTIQQLEKDEDVARKLQEELDHEFAMSLQSSSPDHHPFGGAGVGGAMGGPTEPLDTSSELDTLTPVGRRRRGRRPVPAPAPRAGRQPSSEPGELREELMSLLQDAYHSMHTALESHNIAINNEYLLSPRSRRGRGRRGRRNGMVGFMFNSLDNNNDYEQLMNLAEALGDVKEKGLSEVETSRLPTVTYQPTEDAETPECNICMNEYEKGDTQKILPCFHTYHATCIDKWIQKNATCPVCRVEVKL